MNKRINYTFLKKINCSYNSVTSENVLRHQKLNISVCKVHSIFNLYFINYEIKLHVSCMAKYKVISIANFKYLSM